MNKSETPPSYSTREALSWALKRFGENSVSLVVATFGYGVMLAVLWNAIWYLVNGADQGFSSGANGWAWRQTASENIGPNGAGVLLIGTIVTIAVIGAMASAYLRGVLAISDGQPVTTASFFKPRKVGQVVLASLAVGIAIWIGTALCVLPGMIVAVFTIFTVFALLDLDLTAAGAIKASISVAKANFGRVALAWLVSVALTVIGSLLLGVGLLVTEPIAALFLMFTFRRLSGRQIS